MYLPNIRYLELSAENRPILHYFLYGKVEIEGEHKSSTLGQNDPPMGQSFWSKDSLITHILFELCLFRHLAQCTLFLLTL